ncbi:MAG: hypothetical protein IJS08_12845 [Victivallales bacterium]|nr:hypothetical protein [Victivallales bacterium]
MSSIVKCPICGHALTALGDYYECHTGCRVRLPENVLGNKYDILPIVVLGMSTVGKSCYIGALLNLLDKQEGNGFFWKESSLRPYNDKENPYENNDEKNLFKRYTNAYNNGLKRVVPDSTHKASADFNDDRIFNPLLIKMDFDDCDREFLGMRVSFRLFGHHFFGRKRQILLCIRDVAGEDMVNSRGKVLNDYPILRYAKAVFMMVEPQQLQGVEKLIREMIREKTGGGEEAEKLRSYLGLKRIGQGDDGVSIINLLAEIWNGYGGIRDCPLAICVSKSDTLRKLKEFNNVNNNPLFNLTSTKTCKGCVDLSDLEELNDFVKERLLYNGASNRDLLMQLEKEFKYTCFFAVSAFGFDAIENDDGTHRQMLRDNITSKRVLEPLLWALWQEGYLGGCE